MTCHFGTPMIKTRDAGSLQTFFLLAFLGVCLWRLGEHGGFGPLGASEDGGLTEQKTAILMGKTNSYGHGSKPWYPSEHQNRWDLQGRACPFILG